MWGYLVLSQRRQPAFRFIEAPSQSWRIARSPITTERASTASRFLPIRFGEKIRPPCNKEAVRLRDCVPYRRPPPPQCGGWSLYGTHCPNPSSRLTNVSSLHWIKVWSRRSQAELNYIRLMILPKTCFRLRTGPSDFHISPIASSTPLNNKRYKVICGPPGADLWGRLPVGSSGRSAPT